MGAMGKKTLLIGLTCMEEGDKNRINRAYTAVIEELEVAPVLIPSLENLDLSSRLIEKLSGIILTGGVDVDPSYFGEEPRPGQGQVEPVRDRMEISLARKALEYDIPILGVCRGMQVLNIAAGGDIYQDIYTQVNEPIEHRQQAPGYHPTHRLEVVPGTLFHNIVGINNFRVNSFHHQAVKNIPPGFVACAKAPDGIVEAVESKNNKFALAVQYHPELMCCTGSEIKTDLNYNDNISRGIFKAFINACI